MIPSFLKEFLDPVYWNILIEASKRKDFGPIEKRFSTLKSSDPLMKPFKDESGTKYYKSFAQTVAPKIIPAIRESFRTGRPPEIAVSFSEIDSTRSRLGIGRFGSPQDVLYGFTSERYKKWGDTLHGMGFTAACMSKPTEAVLTMAPRYLTLGKPDEEIRELKGAISSEFNETNKIVFSQIPFIDRYKSLCQFLEIKDLSQPDATLDTILRIQSQLNELDSDLADKLEINRLILLKQLREVIGDTPSERRIRALFEQNELQEPDVTQEQIVLKYVTEGNYLQKLLGGQRVEHIQSNIKQRPNLLRDYKCEVDALYRVVGQKRILLLEAKGKELIARAQLYGIYETFRSFLPVDWELDVVAAMVTPPTNAQRESGVSTCIDLVKIGLGKNLPETFTERLIQVKAQSHYRWLIN